ncbi:diaminobutyrate acetyltransferase [Aliivibrio fischeri]|uniref:diaminobutyrate acetyltransferase n=1 Tax=Aliivibrio fischeri TaxID=668 RepID=UPI001F27A4D1|nr:diaminobutyrate acetyltransferase [Aliivibrio fischeri]MCE4936506.1 diaminobutyrate acetyltransferase [Aliivibrio fischeri]
MAIAAPRILCPDMDSDTTKKWIFREPLRTDGDDVYALITECPPLDINSSYCNFLQATHFSKTCVLAEKDSDLAGFISGYQKPDEPNTLFIWQVAVSPRYRGKGLAFSMLATLLERKNLLHIEFIETTITKENNASWSLFKKIDAQYGNQGQITTFLDKESHFKGKHDTEYLYRIPLKSSQK